MSGVRTETIAFRFAALMALIALAGCGASDDRAGAIPASGTSSRVSAHDGGSGRIRVVCTTGMVADLASHVGGEHVVIDALMGSGVDPHLYKPSIRDVSRMMSGDLVVYSGLKLEGKLAGLFERMERRKPTLPVSGRIDPALVLTLDEHHADPHLWFDVKLWSRGLDVVRDKLAEIDPDHAGDYRRNAEAYRRRLEALDEECRRELAKVPEPQRVLVTAHDAFHYFGRAYGLEVKAIQGISTESEASVKEINELVRFLVDRKIKAVFVESTVNDRNIEALIEGCRARGHAIRIGGQLFSDAMGDPGTPEGTYEGMVRHNVRTIVQGLL